MRLNQLTYSILVLALCTGCAEQPMQSSSDSPSEALIAKVNGSVKIHGDSWQVKDVAAFQDKEVVLIAFTDVPFDRKEFALDGKLDSFDILQHKGNKITLSIDGTGPSSCLDFSNHSGGGSLCNNDIQNGIKITSKTKGRIAGTVNWGANTPENTNIHFDTTIQTKLARIGEALPADGGEPGQVLLAHFSALQRGDFEALKAQASPEQLEKMNATSPADVKDMLKMLKEMSPTQIRITGGVINGDSAIVDFTGVNHTEQIQGVATLSRINGRWCLDKTSEAIQSDQ